MAVPTKTYFLCPISEFIHPPPAGPLCLGSIIRSTSAPQYPLNRANIVAVADAFPPVVETNWRKTISTETGLGVGVFAQFLQTVSVEHSKKATSAFAFDSMTTLAFEPTEDYVREAVKAPAVQAWLREPRQRFAPSVSLFIVTAIKLVRGARVSYSTAQSIAVKVNLGLDATALGVPGIDFGPKGRWITTEQDGSEFDRGASEFVFAFRVKRLRFGRKLEVEEYNKGAFMAVGRQEGEEDGEHYMLVEDVDGSKIKNAQDDFDVTENGSVFCIPA